MGNTLTSRKMPSDLRDEKQQVNLRWVILCANVSMLLLLAICSNISADNVENLMQC